MQTLRSRIDLKYWLTMVLLVVLYALAGTNTWAKWAFTFAFPPLFGLIAVYIVTAADLVYKPSVFFPRWVYLVWILLVGIIGSVVWIFRGALPTAPFLYGGLYAVVAIWAWVWKIFVPKTKAGG